MIVIYTNYKTVCKLAEILEHYCDVETDDDVAQSFLHIMRECKAQSESEMLADELLEETRANSINN